MAQMVKNPPVMWEIWVQSLGWEDSLGGGHGNPLQYSCLETEEPGYSTWGHKESDTTEQLRHSTVAKVLNFSDVQVPPV